MKRSLAALLLMVAPLFAVSSKLAVIGSLHDMTAAGTGPVKSSATDSCIFCHAPHNVNPNITPLWDHNLSVQTYTMYTSTTYSSGVQTPSAGSSKLCLSCHDGTVAVGLTVVGTITTSGAMAPLDVFGSNLATSHPVSMTAANDGQLSVTLFATPATTKDPAVLLVSGKTECTTCHDPHVPNKDAVAKNFLVRSNSGGTLCLACHDPSRTQPNQLFGWTAGAHATSTNTVPTTAATFGAYGNVAANACSNCHGAHQNAVGPRNVRAKEEATCSPCHGGANVTPAIGNIMTEFTKVYAHPTTTVSGAHDAAEAVPVLGTRHSECEDCHNNHTAAAQAAIPVPPLLPASLLGVSGYDTAGIQKPATKEYQLCYKCHADSTNKPAASTYGRTSPRYPVAALPSTYTPNPPLPPDQYNVRLKFTSTIGHNVMGNSVSTTANTTLKPYATDINGANILTRPLTSSSLLYCTDCHNNNASRTINSTGPDGPHGSTFAHLLQFTLYQEPLGGGSGNTTAGSAMCGKCHNLTTVSNLRPHNDHRAYACTTCHDPHGVIGGNISANFAMLNFDTSIVKTTGTTAYLGNYANGNSHGCYLSCHGQGHNPYTY